MVMGSCMTALIKSFDCGAIFFCRKTRNTAYFSHNDANFFRRDALNDYDFCVFLRYILTMMVMVNQSMRWMSMIFSFSHAR